MTISRGQMNRQLYMGGGIMNVMPREQFGVGSFVKKAVKKVTGAVKDVASSDIGKAALAGAAVYGLGGGTFFGRGLPGIGSTGGFGFGKIMPNLFGTGAVADYGTGTKGILGSLGLTPGFGIKGITKRGIGTAIAGSGLIAGLLTKAQMEEIDEADPDERGDIVAEKLRQSLTRLGVSGQELEDRVAEGVSEYTGYTSKAEGGRIGYAEGSDDKIPAELLAMSGFRDAGSDDKIPAELLAMSGFRDAGPVLPEFNLESNIIPLSNDGEFKYTTPSEILPEFKYMSDGPVLPPDPTQPVNPFGPKPTGPVLPDRMASNEISIDKIEMLIKRGADNDLIKEFTGASDGVINQIRDAMERKNKAGGGIMNRMNYALGDTASQNAMQAAGIEGLPVRQNPKGVKELDLRDSGGFIPPVGIKEKEDDIPAMLSNNEFVFTADAVRGMGNGDVELGAQRMYDQMKMLEAGGKV